jgi:hypothetical protein
LSAGIPALLGGKRRKRGREEEMGREEEREKDIFIASSCSFFGMISSMCGARRGYVVTSWLRIARWTEDLTLDFEPGEMLLLLARKYHKIVEAAYSFLNILADLKGVVE